MKTIIRIIKSLLKWIFSHKKIVFLYIPIVFAIFIFTYVMVIYFSFQQDRDMALKKLSRYKQLIDRTEELRQGLTYSYGKIDLNKKVVDLPSRIYDRKNELIGEFFEQKREIVPYNYIPKWIVNGVIASEDRDFYKHRGISFKGILRAFVINLARFRVAQGGSTITQQLAKVLFTNMKRSLKRKIYEAFCAREIERLYDKQDILSMYLNLIYFGNGAYGVESTSKMFFGRPVKKLNEVECAMIIATISNPMVYSPLSNLKNSVRKTKRILHSLVDAGFINKRRALYQYKQFVSKWDIKFNEKKEAVSSLIGKFIYSSYRINRAPFFNERIRRVLVEKFGEEVVKKGGLSVYTTLDAVKQDMALKMLRKGIDKQRAYHLRRSKRIKKKYVARELDKAKNTQGALVAVNPETGEIISYVGGYDFSVHNQNDNVSQIKRQPGSSIKPIVYAAAIQEKDITPSSIFVDRKTKFKGGYSPGNYDNKYAGKITVRRALRESKNIVAVKVLKKTGYNRIFDILEKSLSLSDSEVKKRFGKTLSLTLGTYEISPIENAVLHSVLVNGGKFVKPYGIKYVKDYNGNIVWNNEEKVIAEIKRKRISYNVIIDPIACAITISLLQAPSYYPVRRKKMKFQVAGKTGTSSKYIDAWFVGYTQDLVTAVWVGNKQGAISLGRGRAGMVVSAPIWADFISSIYITPPPNFTVPRDGVSKEKICLDSGLVAREGVCPHIVKDQLYYEGSEPGEFCNLHKGISGDSNSTK
ncbi:transglycosylase domain-containing protein [Spirochaetota bacterium]